MKKNTILFTLLLLSITLTAQLNYANANDNNTDKQTLRVVHLNQNSDKIGLNCLKFSIYDHNNRRVKWGETYGSGCLEFEKELRGRIEFFYNKNNQLHKITDLYLPIDINHVGFNSEANCSDVLIILPEEFSDIKCEHYFCPGTDPTSCKSYTNQKENCDTVFITNTKVIDKTDESLNSFNKIINDYEHRLEKARLNIKRFESEKKYLNFQIASLNERISQDSGKNEELKIKLSVARDSLAEALDSLAFYKRMNIDLQKEMQLVKAEEEKLIKDNIQMFIPEIQAFSWRPTDGSGETNNFNNWRQIRIDRFKSTSSSKAGNDYSNYFIKVKVTYNNGKGTKFLDIYDYNPAIEQCKEKIHLTNAQGESSKIHVVKIKPTDDAESIDAIYVELYYSFRNKEYLVVEDAGYKIRDSDKRIRKGTYDWRPCKNRTTPVGGSSSAKK